MVTLAWASMNMADLKSLEGLDDGTMIHLWSFFLFTLYHGVSMIVLLNMLIAMMSNSYQQIEVEWNLTNLEQFVASFKYIQESASWSVL